MMSDCNVKNIEHCPIRMSDGVRLSARIWLPDCAPETPVPAILEYIPYRKRDMVRVRDERNHVYFAQCGFASVRVDMRGSGDSEGVMVDMYEKSELSDAVEIIQWLAAQKWCNGAVGMMGTSWGGTSSLQAALLGKPPELKAIIAVCATDNRFCDDIHYSGGCVLTDTLEWGATLPAILASPPDPMIVGDNWRELWMRRLEHLEFPLEKWLEHQKFDEYWQFGSVSQSQQSMDCPALLIGGWCDRYSNTVMNLMQQKGENCWGIVGPWGHHYPDQASPGPAMQFQRLAVQWWNYWLKGIKNGIDSQPKLRLWLQTYDTPGDRIDRRSGFWTAFRSWPSDAVATQTYHLGNGRLNVRRCKSEQTAIVPFDLRVGRCSGDTGYFGRSGGLALDQQSEDDLCLTFDTDELKAPLDIVGSATLVLVLESSKPAAQCAARLCDVAPDGSVARIGFAVRNLALDDEFKSEVQLGAGKKIRCAIRFPNTAYRVKAGHKLRLAISGSYWPLAWPNAEPAESKIYLNDCRLNVPAAPDCEPAANPCDADESFPDFSRHQLLANPPLARWIDEQSDPQKISVCWKQPERIVRYDDIDLMFGFKTKACHAADPSEPGSAISKIDHQMSFCRKKWKVIIASTVRMTATRSGFEVLSVLEVRENDTTIFSRESSATIPRSCS